MYSSFVDSSEDDVLPAVFVRSQHFKPLPGSVVAVTAIAFVFSDKAELTDVVLEDGLTVRSSCLFLPRRLALQAGATFEDPFLGRRAD